MSKKIQSVSIIGSGNVAYGLGRALNKVVNVEGIWSRRHENARELAGRLKCWAAEEIVQLLDSDLVIVAVTDHAIPSIGERLRDSLKALKKEAPTIVHTSGSVSVDPLNPGRLTIDTGVLYPLQSFTYGRRISLKAVPFFIHGNRESTIERLVALARMISSEVHIMSDEERRKLHLPAVMVNNFVNHLVYLGEKIAKEDGLRLEFYVPLIEETIKKIKSIGPYRSQTGPAKRNDVEVMEGHMQRLKQHPELKEIYKLLSNSIKETYYEDHR